MDKVIFLKPAGQRRADILLQVDLDVVVFSLLDWRNFCHSTVFLCIGTLRGGRIPIRVLKLPLRINQLNSTGGSYG
jgi:hypothetical protein